MTAKGNRTIHVQEPQISSSLVWRIDSSQCASYSTFEAKSRAEANHCKPFYGFVVKARRVVWWGTGYNDCSSRVTPFGCWIQTLTRKRRIRYITFPSDTAYNDVTSYTQKTCLSVVTVHYRRLPWQTVRLQCPADYMTAARKWWAWHSKVTRDKTWVIAHISYSIGFPARKQAWLWPEIQAQTLSLDFVRMLLELEACGIHPA